MQSRGKLAKAISHQLWVFTWAVHIRAYNFVGFIVPETGCLGYPKTISRDFLINVSSWCLSKSHSWASSKRGSQIPAYRSLEGLGVCDWEAWKAAGIWKGSLAEVKSQNNILSVHLWMWNEKQRSKLVHSIYKYALNTYYVKDCSKHRMKQPTRHWPCPWDSCGLTERQKGNKC